MSEYGCITNTRTFEEVAALYNTEMTGVFSGGLVYEYSQEGNDYGLVTISGDTVTPNSDFTALQSAYSAQANPTGNGGASSTSASTTCPTKSSEWDVANDDLPAIPAAAEVYISAGAGAGPGLSGTGSQNSGNSSTESTGTASAGSGTVTETATSSSKKSEGARAPTFDFRALTVGVAILFSMAGGMALL
jgi:1,3-beta-glucanosyltransferase GAS5